MFCGSSTERVKSPSLWFPGRCYAVNYSHQPGKFREKEELLDKHENQACPQKNLQEVWRSAPHRQLLLLFFCSQKFHPDLCLDLLLLTGSS